MATQPRSLFHTAYLTHKYVTEMKVRETGKPINLHIFIYYYNRGAPSTIHPHQSCVQYV